MLRAVPKPKFIRRVPTQAKRGQFSKDVRRKILLRDTGFCRVCGTLGTQIHHVMPRSRGGRGVYTNGMLTCNTCHHEIHQDNSKLKYWQNNFREEYGDDYYRDIYDMEGR